MGRFKPGGQRSCLVSHSLWCDCGVPRGRRDQPCRPPWPILATQYYLNDNWSPILPVEFVKKVRGRNLRRLEPKEEDDGELTELEDTKDEEGNDTEAPFSEFAGKKKKKAKKDGSNNALSASSFGLLGEGDDVKKVRERNLRRIEPMEDDDGVLTELEDTKDEEGNDTEAPFLKFAGKKKGKAKKDGSNNAFGR
ncbi:Hypothetical predicted protein [Olea europaea subsp. europaea]|uniref:Uncharacterized protein n=1 Tax=Olea europaea subsp. europaea TaxID=158383 RepID=A0A8S0Q2J2_OLEEU|nr:Hypothetical predicted protein [Olea europaea subsp. europaea]